MVGPTKADTEIIVSVAPPLDPAYRMDGMLNLVGWNRANHTNSSSLGAGLGLVSLGLVLVGVATAAGDCGSYAPNVRAAHPLTDVLFAGAQP
jgi:hypothetical protein